MSDGMLSMGLSTHLALKPWGLKVGDLRPPTAGDMTSKEPPLLTSKERKSEQKRERSDPAFLKQTK